MERNSVFDDVINLKSIVWKNPYKISAEEALSKFSISYEDILDAEARLKRFAPLIKKLFPEVEDGIIESPLVEIHKFKKEMESFNKGTLNGNLYLKCDSHLAIAGSIKARGGIYEVLYYAETLAINSGMLDYSDDYSKLTGKEFIDFFSKYRILVGSTGNLGLSIGIISRALGFKVTVHMSQDAKEWKKTLLKEKGALVVEHAGDFSMAVDEARKQSQEDNSAYFIDDEGSKQLFLGYAVAALRLANQLKEKGITVNEDNQLHVYLPCGVGGGPGGITFGLKHLFGENVHCYLVEPAHSCCMLLGLITRRYDGMHVNDYGVDNITEADGLAVGRPSRFVSLLLERLIDGIHTISDNDLYLLLYILGKLENIKVEPSAAASLMMPFLINNSDENGIHICWATGGLLIPDEIYLSMYNKGRSLASNC